MDRPSIHLCDRLDRQELADICTGSADLILSLSDDGRIEDASTTLVLPRCTVAGWIGRRITEIASPESVEKLQHLLTLGVAAEAPLWRHANLLASDGSTVPLLVRFTGPLLLARDLMPLHEAAARFQREQMELIRHYEDRLAAVEAACRNLREALAEKHGADKVVAKRVTWQSARDALRAAQADHDRAAALVGLTVADFDRILAAGPGGT